MMMIHSLEFDLTTMQPAMEMGEKLSGENPIEYNTKETENNVYLEKMGLVKLDRMSLVIR